MAATDEAVGGRRRGRAGGGGAARRAERTAVVSETARVIERLVPTVEVLDTEALERIEDAAEQVLAEIGVNFVDNPAALARWRDAGADVQGERVTFPRGLVRGLCATAPGRFTQHARNPAKSVDIGGDRLVLAPVYGPPFVLDLDGHRRYATIADFHDFVKLGQMTPWLHHSGGTVCEPTDIAANKRHLDMLLAHMTLSDKPFMGSVTEPERARHSVEMCEILFGADFVAQNTVLTSLININSPLTFDSTMMGALETYAAAGQACILSPFIVGGAMSPVTVAGTLVQVLAEVQVAIAYSQLIRPGAPVIFGAFVTSIDMNSGAPTFGTPEASQVIFGAGQLARRMGVPFRSGGGFTGSKLPDAQAGYESANSLNTALLAGVNFMLHACGWLEGGLVASPEKFVMDADQLGALHRLAARPAVDDMTLAMDALREVGPGGHFLGCAHTQANFKTAFWRSGVLDYRPFETWEDDGAPDTRRLANAKARKMLADYQPPALDPAIREALEAYIARRKDEVADAFA
ncbi:trimethylamine methyltransferase [Meridianimarinicoccus roseus]|jgi:trimethylamine--corrinoid protein Co-methyltransferase|uniref:Methyltransferase n=1 Tax=Meridianimarinicoccus roseus TaxID=2072018 RepID=A0A2V2LKW6_9RHOB|nr:trimethylamine methyltransferase family protein [Meridianimarinicoccus roseus]PWR02959.1 trimethylamine methyltransferase [Meridianimarinicoccus roseus]